MMHEARHYGTPSGRFPLRLAALIAIMSALPATPPAAAQSLVIGFSGVRPESYRVGTRLADGQAVLLAAAEKLTVLEAGGTRVFVGPGRFVTGSTGPAQVSLDRMRDARPRAHVAATRALGTRAPDTLWSIDIDRGGDACILEGVQPRLWRMNGLASRTLDLRGRDPAPSTILFRAGMTSLDWPADRPVTEGERYTIGDAAGAVTLVWHKLAPVTDLAALAQALDKAGCTSQLDRLL